MNPATLTRSFVIMGVSGSGKTTIGVALAEKIGRDFVDGDDLHSDKNKAIMAAGIALTDKERNPWLEAIGVVLRKAKKTEAPIVITCSALKRNYRDLLRTFDSDILFIHLDGSKKEIAKRIASRVHEYMQPALLDSQFATLEPLEQDENGIRVEISGTPSEIIAHIIREIS